MFKTNYLKISSFFLIVGFLFVSILPLHVLAEDIEPQTPVFVDPQVVQDLQSKGTTSYWIDFKNQPDLTPAYTMDWRSRGQYVYEQLSKEADQSQRNVRAYLDEGNISYQSFWIKNSILVLESNLNVVNGLLNFSEISAIRPVKEYLLYAPEQVDSAFDNGINGVGSNISRVKADQAWALGYTGEGLVVANIDTGVRYTHQALVNQYRGNLGGGSFDHDYNWFDPYNTYLSPADGHGHGTHTMGTAIGDDGGANQIGMAPGANWIACRGCNSNSCADSALLTCAQFITAPTKTDGTVPNPDLRAHVVNNSWGDCNRSYDDWYQDVVDAWHAAGIYPVFSNGNNSNCGYSRPPGLNTVGNPARYGNVTGVGSSGNSDGQYATHSNWGPTDNPDTINAKAGFDMMKPQVVAPGVNIRSSVPSSDTAYQNGWSGTSMSAPHVTGLVALMWQAGPCLVGDYALTETLLEDTATPMTYDDGSPLTPTNYPNFATGWGEINALAAVQAAASICGATTLRGVVSGLEMCDVNPAPLGGATVNIYDHGALLTSLTTDGGGNYIFALDAGTYDLEVVMNGYVTQTVFGVVLEEGANLVNNFELRLNAPCLSVAPTSLVETLAPDRTKTQTLKLSNTGAGKADFTLIDMPVPLLPDVQLVSDPSFEGYTPNSFWKEYSELFGTPLCTIDDCGTGTGTGPRTGDVWSWFGGSYSGDSGYVSQDVTIGVGLAELSFYVEQYVCGIGGVNNYLRLLIDDHEIWRTDGTDPACGVFGYRQIELDVSAYADGNLHEIKFDSNTVGEGNFFLDDVELYLSPASDVPWLSENPESGTIPASGEVDITVTFDSTGLVKGEYLAKIRIRSPQAPMIDVPVTLVVTEGSGNRTFLPLIVR